MPKKKKEKEITANEIIPELEKLFLRIEHIEDLVKILATALDVNERADSNTSEEALPEAESSAAEQSKCGSCEECGHCADAREDVDHECSIDVVRTDAGNVRIMKVAAKHFVELQTGGQGTVWCPIVKVKGSPCLELLDADLLERNEDIIEALGLSAAVLDVRNTFADRLMKKLFLY